MVDDKSTVTDAATGNKIDCESFVRGADTVLRQRMQIAGSVNAEIARVLNAAPTLTDYGLVVRLTDLPTLAAGTNNIGDVDVLTLPALAAGVNRIGKVILRNPADTLDIGDVTNPVRVDPTGTTSQPVSGTVTVNAGTGVFDVTPATPLATDYLPARVTDGTAFIDPRDVSDRAARLLGVLSASTNNIGDVDVLTLPALVAGTANIGDVDILTMPLTTVHSDIAHDVIDSGNPLKIGGKANLNEITAVAENDRVNAWFDLIGRQTMLIGHANPEPPVTANGSAAGVVVIAAPGAGVSLYIMKGSIHNRGVEQVISLRDGAAGTIRFTMNAAADGGGTIFDFGSRGWKLTANTALVADIGAASADVNITEFYIAV